LHHPKIQHDAPLPLTTDDMIEWMKPEVLDGVS
jgi:hypothetical protein